MYTSPKVAKKLKEAGFKKNAGFFWYPSKTDPDTYELKHWSEINLKNAQLNAIPAYTLSELIRELPPHFFVSGHCEGYDHTEDTLISINADTPEDAAALAWIESQKRKGK
jgi:hypothetical protein